MSNKSMGKIQKAKLVSGCRENNDNKKQKD